MGGKRVETRGKIDGVGIGEGKVKGQNELVRSVNR